MWGDVAVAVAGDHGRAICQGPGLCGSSQHWKMGTSHICRPRAQSPNCLQAKVRKIRVTHERVLTAAVRPVPAPPPADILLRGGKPDGACANANTTGRFTICFFIYFLVFPHLIVLPDDTSILVLHSNCDTEP